MISKSFVMRCLNSGGTVHYRKSRNSAPQPNQGSSVPQQSSAADEAKIAPPRQAARIRLEGLTYLNQASKISGKLYFEGPAEIDGQIDGRDSCQGQYLDRRECRRDRPDYGNIDHRRGKLTVPNLGAQGCDVRGPLRDATGEAVRGSKGHRVSHG
jgi:hypothetical protein